MLCMTFVHLLILFRSTLSWVKISYNPLEIRGMLQLDLTARTRWMVFVDCRGVCGAAGVNRTIC